MMRLLAQQPPTSRHICHMCVSLKNCNVQFVQLAQRSLARLDWLYSCAHSGQYWQEDSIHFFLSISLCDIHNKVMYVPRSLYRWVYKQSVCFTSICWWNSNSDSNRICAWNIGFRETTRIPCLFLYFTHSAHTIKKMFIALRARKRMPTMPMQISIICWISGADAQRCGMTHE